MSRGRMTGLAVVVGIAIIIGVAVNIALVIFSLMSTHDFIRLDSQVQDLTSYVTILNQSLKEASSSSALLQETLNVTLEEKTAFSENSLENLKLTLEEKASSTKNSLDTLKQTLDSTERRLEILTSSMNLRFDSLNKSFMASLHAVSSDQVVLASRQNIIKDSVDSLRSCQQYRDLDHRTSGIYPLNPWDGGGPFLVYCDMQSDEYGWVVIQRRIDGVENFYRNWADYKIGFGRLEAEFWLGNDNLHRLTASGLTRLRVDLEDWENDSAYAMYSSFSVAGENENYKLDVSGYNGTAGDSLAYLNGHRFSTKDKDNDPWYGNCAEDRTGAWWYASCTYSNLNGLYNITANGDYRAVIWGGWKGITPLKSTEMKIR